jgi:hypothetical protein
LGNCTIGHGWDRKLGEKDSENTAVRVARCWVMPKGTSVKVAENALPKSVKIIAKVTQVRPVTRELIYSDEVTTAAGADFHYPSHQ